MAHFMIEWRVPEEYTAATPDELGPQGIYLADHSGVVRRAGTLQDERGVAGCLALVECSTPDEAWSFAVGAPVSHSRRFLAPRIAEVVFECGSEQPARVAAGRGG